jgi:alcohol dehydrogenase (cytochrome c)
VPSPQGTVIFPGVQGGTNWFAPSYSPKTDLFYLNVWDDYSSIYFAWDQEYELGKWYAGGGIKAEVQSTRRDRLARRDPKSGYGAVRALNPSTGAKVWEYKTSDVSDGGIVTTASNLLFTGNREGNVFALDATNGKLLWTLYLGGQTVASPMTYLVNGKQRVTIAVGHTLYTFGLRD